MDFPTYVSRKDMEYKLNLLQESARRGHIRVFEGATQLVDSLVKIRPTPNIRYDLSTVDELVRPALLMTNLNSEIDEHE